MAQAAAMRTETENYLQMVSKGLSQLSGLFSQFSGRFGSFAGSFAQLLGGVGNLSKLDIGKIFKEGKGSSSGVLGNIQGGLAAAGPLGQVAGTVMSLWKSFFDMFNSSMKKLIEDAHDKVSKALDDSMNALRVGSRGLTQTVNDLKNQLAHVEDNYPAAKGNAPWWSWIVPLMGAGWQMSNHMSDSGRQEAIDQDSANLTRQIAQLAQDAQNALYTLEHDTLPALRVTPGMRQFEEELGKIRKELDGLAQTPGITQGELNEMFNIRLADLARDLQGQMLEQRQEYLDVLKHERDLKTQLTDLDKDAAQVQEDYKTQRAQILGLATRELSKSEQLAKLAKDKQEKLDDIAKRRTDLQTELDYVEKQKAAYEAIYGVVTDIGAYEISIQDQLLAKTQERLGSLSTFLKEVQAWMTGPMWNFITNNGATMANGNPYALPVVLVNPQPIKDLEPTNPGKNEPPPGDNQVQYNMYGDIHVKGNMTQGEARKSFLDAWKSFHQDNAARGLAHSNA